MNPTKAIPILAAMALAGALTAKGTESPVALPDAGDLDVPGRPEVIFTPRRTMGH